MVIDQAIMNDVKAQILKHYMIEICKAKFNLIAYETVEDEKGIEFAKKELEKWEKIYQAIEVS